MKVIKCSLEVDQQKEIYIAWSKFKATLFENNGRVCVHDEDGKWEPAVDTRFLNWIRMERKTYEK